MRCFCTVTDSTDIIIGAKKLYQLRMVQEAPQKTLPFNVQYNPTLQVFFAIGGHSILRWDAHTARSLSPFVGVTGHEITCLTMDDRARKLVLGSIDGSVHVVNVVNGYAIKSSERAQSHSGACLGVFYAKRDQCIMSIGADGWLHV